LFVGGLMVSGFDRRVCYNKVGMARLRSSVLSHAEYRLS
jgi:hypothetical protein